MQRSGGGSRVVLAETGDVVGPISGCGPVCFLYRDLLEKSGLKMRVSPGRKRVAIYQSCLDPN